MYMLSLEFSTGQEMSQEKSNRVKLSAKNVNNLGICVAKMLGNWKSLVFSFKTCFQPQYLLLAAHRDAKEPVKSWMQNMIQLHIWDD